MLEHIVVTAHNHLCWLLFVQRNLDAYLDRRAAPVTIFPGRMAALGKIDQQVEGGITIRAMHRSGIELFLVHLSYAPPRLCPP